MLVAVDEAELVDLGEPRPELRRGWVTGDEPGAQVVGEVDVVGDVLPVPGGFAVALASRRRSADRAGDRGSLNRAR